MAEPPPVEYAVAVERYLAASGLAEGSRRIYRIALNTWAWALADRPAPTGPERRRARPPVLPLALLDHPDAARRLRTAADRRRADTDPRTLNRELSTLRAAVAWWRARRWLDDDPTTDLHPGPPGPTVAPLTPDDLRALFTLRAPLREQSLWHLLHESGAAIDTVLALDTDDLDLPRHRTLHRPGRTPSTGGAAPPGCSPSSSPAAPPARSSSPTAAPPPAPPPPTAAPTPAAPASPTAAPPNSSPPTPPP